jgi:cellulose synthase (UDP-forming)
MANRCAYCFIKGSYLLVIASGLLYLSWVFLNIHWQYWYVAVPFFIAEVNFFILFLLWDFIIRNGLKRRKSCIIPAERVPDVDVFITTCHEPLSELEKTLRATLNIDYERKHIYVLDDGASNDVKKLCDELSVKYISRPTHENRKAGNLNYALKFSTSDFIMTLDADQVPKPAILKDLVGCLEDPQVAFSQTKQEFVLPKHDPWSNSDDVFYDIMQPSKAVDNAAISCGSGIIYRKKAIESIGGFSTWNVVEDLYSSMLLQAKGWKGIYIDEAYSKGTAPTEIISQVRQRWQWAVDSLRVLFWDCPLFKKGLDYKQRLQYTHYGYNYLVFGIFLPLIFCVPVWALLANKSFLTAPWWLYIVYRMIYYIFHKNYIYFALKIRHKFKGFQIQSGLCFAFFTATIVALFSKNRVIQYKVTPKVPGKSNFWQRMWRIAPHLLLIGVLIIAVSHGVMSHWRWSWFSIVNIFWALTAIVILSRFVVLGFIKNLSVVDDR